MLQRIQTVYLIIVAVLMLGLYFWFPIFTDEAGNRILSRQDWSIFPPIFISASLAIISIISYKNRLRQFILNRINILINFILLGVFVYTSLVVSGETIVSEKGIGILIPVFSIVFLVLANKAIKRDEDLVKSVDRLR
ncbi:MAG: DUF4293 domain-containing protein [Bacteroidetes bacterium]|nr:DUF4293 domain-containing protein [Bacteroidota bacterium]